MLVFSVKKVQAGQDVFGDDFSHRDKIWIVCTTSREKLAADIAKVNGVEIYSGEYLYLDIGEELNDETVARPLHSYLSGYYIPKNLLAQLSR